jgi:hypothetical protein
MGKKESYRTECFCAFCKSPRKIYAQKRVGLVNVLASALGAGIGMYLLFREFDPRVFMIFVVLLAISEVFVQLRWRIAMTCRQCGFDPVLYLKDVNAAVAKVQKRLAERKEDPMSLLSAPLKISRRIKRVDVKDSMRAEALENALARPSSATTSPNSKRGRLVSRQI